MFFYTPALARVGPLMQTSVVCSPLSVLLYLIMFVDEKMWELFFKGQSSSHFETR